MGRSVGWVGGWGGVGVWGGLRGARLLCEDESGEQDRPPRRAQDGYARDGDEPLDVHERDDQALGGEARARVDRVQRMEDGLLCGHLHARGRCGVRVCEIDGEAGTSRG